MTVALEARVTERPYRPLGRRLREIRRGAGLTQGQMGERIGYSASFVSALELGKHQPDTDLLARYERLFGADYNELARLAGYQRDVSDAEWVPPAEYVPYLREITEGGRSTVEQAVAFVRTLKSAAREMYRSQLEQAVHELPDECTRERAGKPG